MLKQSLLSALILFIALILVPKANGAKMLVSCVFGSYSMNIAIHPFAVGLAEKGHDVTFLSSHHFKEKDARVTYFTPDTTYKANLGLLGNLGDPDDRISNVPNVFTNFYPHMLDFCKVFFGDPIVQEWINKSTFDLLIMDGIFNECSLALVHKFKAPYVLFHSAPFLPWHGDLFGLPVESSWLPDIRLNFTTPMTFLERVYNTFHTLQIHLYDLSYDHYPDIIKIMRSELKDPTIPEVSTLYENASLIFVNSYFSSEYARSLPPFVIPVGGIHCATPKGKLTAEMETFIAKKAPDGFVYISFGTAFKPAGRSLHAIFQSLKKFPKIGFIFRWFGDFPDVKADNVLFVSWAAQQALLAHPKIRAFASHCGMSSTQEIINYGVPVLAIPGFADQDYNAECLMRLGAGRRLELTDFDEATFEEALRDVLTNPKYKDRLRMLNSLYHDRPQKPLETAVWWSEYVLRHSKAGSDLSLMKPLGIKQYWWQRRLVDVYFFVFLVLFVIAGIFAKLGCLICKSINIFKAPKVAPGKKSK